MFAKMHISFKHSLLGRLASQWNAVPRADGSRRLLTAPAVLGMMCLLSGCLAQSQIQGKYMDSQEECRNETARSVMGGETARPVSESQASPIAQRFSDCMTKEGWHLATPKPGVVAPAAVAAAPNGSSYPTVVTGPPASAYPPASSYPANVPVSERVANPARGAPVTAETASPSPVNVPSIPQTSVPASPDVATYQPGRPSGEATPVYGSGPGRQF